MSNLFRTALFAALALYLACTPKAAPQITAIPIPPEEPIQWDTIGKPLMGDNLEEPAPIEYSFEEPSPADPAALAPYNPAHTLAVDLLHTKVEISFDWENKYANATATLNMRPWFYATSEVTLDAKNFDIHSVTFAGSPKQLKYDYDNTQLTIQLGKTFTRHEEFKLAIIYTAKPDERESYGGSSAITSDKGLFFINADGADKNKPRQIWTQGETENNSCWVPTIDKPNERCTQEMYITVDDQFKTLSNGLLISSKKNADGTRTDYWKMDKPHAPYLFMMAIGEYAIVQDKWRGIDVDYYVEPKFESYARDIYPYTIEMLEFFSNKLDYPYPWSKFSQVVVRDYVSGAMENTTSVIFGEFMQKTKRELMDDGLTNEKVVAHEMFHQWFGDLVTTESWANLTLNEGFANYSEYLWMEQKHGRDAADHHLLTEQEGYFLSAGNGGHPLINFGYQNREDMFDSHSYNKGGCILHMLRQEIGDEAFFASLNHYLKKNEYSAVEADELRLAFEDVTGLDLNWFFNQWFFKSGHPKLDISYSWDEMASKVTITIQQTQKGTDIPYIFELPLAVDIYDADGKASRQNIRVTQRKQSFSFSAPSKPALVNVDAKKSLLAVKTDKHSPKEWAFQYRNAPLFQDRWEAIMSFQTGRSSLADQIFNEALSDNSADIRLKALYAIDYQDTVNLTIIEQMAKTDPDNQVRAYCIAILGEIGDTKYIPVYESGMAENQAYSVATASLAALYKTDAGIAIQKAELLQADDSGAFTEVLSELYAEKPSLDNLPFFENNVDKIDGFPAFPFFQYYQSFMLGLNNQQVLEAGIEKFKSIALNRSTSEWRRFAAAKGIADIRKDHLEKGLKAQADTLRLILDEIKAHETDPILKKYYEGF